VSADDFCSALAGKLRKLCADGRRAVSP
jgi:hypothetical protein